jgi:hypothetical protein
MSDALMDQALVLMREAIRARDAMFDDQDEDFGPVAKSYAVFEVIDRMRPLVNSLTEVER